MASRRLTRRHVRWLLLTVAAFAAACLVSVIVTSLAFNALDAIDFYDTGEDCRTLFCDMRWGRVLVTLLAGVALVPFLSVRLGRAARRRWAASDDLR